VTDLEPKALALPDQARALTITDQATCDAAGEFLRGVATLRKEIVEHHAPLKQKAFEAHRAICDAEKRLLAPVAEAEAAVKRTMGTYLQEQERKRLEAEAEARRAAEEAARQQQQAAALEAIDAGATIEEAEAIVTAPVFVAPVVAPPAPKPKGISTREIWKAEVTDKRAVLAHVLATWPALSHLVTVDESQLNKLANSQRQLFNVPGARAFPVTTTSVRVK
jgi:uncharacterized membrane protein YqiK